MDMSQLLMSMFGGAGQAKMPMPTVSPSQAGGPVAPSQQMPTGLDRMGQVGSLISGLGQGGQQVLDPFQPTTTTTSTAPPVMPSGQHGGKDGKDDWKAAWHQAKEAWRTSRPDGAPGDDPALLAAFQAWRDARPDRHSFNGNGGATNPGMPGMIAPGMMPPAPTPSLTPPAAVAPSQAPMAGGLDINALLQQIFGMGGGGLAANRGGVGA